MTKSARRWAVVMLAAVAIAGALGLLLLTLRSPQPVWVVSSEFTGIWERLLAEAEDAPDWPVIETNDA
ncbi:MAG: hypothetical protein LC641_13170, partial [Spirochaeta sp.]|nr:hypothetical protein [Spirochaeta sp.]